MWNRRITANSEGGEKNGHGLTHICYSNLNNRQREALHFQKISAILADYGFVCTWLTADRRGADFIAVRTNGKALKVQLTSGGFEINKKYDNCEDLWMLFPNFQDWYLIKHKDLVEKAGETTKFLESRLWKEKGMYTISSRARSRIPPKLEQSLKNYMIRSRADS